MILRRTFLQRQKGVVLVLVALCLVVLVGIAALAIDLSHAEVNKTRLQNLADSLALSAAIALNKKEKGSLPCDPSSSYTDKEQYAENYAKKCTLPQFTSAEGNAEIADELSATDFTFQFAKTLSHNTTDWYPSTSGSIEDAVFVRVTMNPMLVNTWFAPIFSLISNGTFNTIPVSNSAVAGTVPLAPCDLAPFAMCAGADQIQVDGSGKVTAKDTNCKDNSKDPTASVAGNPDCYGYELGALYCMKEQSPGGSGDPILCPSSGNIGAGNFGFLDFSGATTPNPALKYCTAGASSQTPGCTTGCNFGTDENGNITMKTKTGQTFSQAKDGFNTRFNLYPGGSSLIPADYPPDQITGHDDASNGTDTNGDGLIDVYDWTLHHRANPDLNNLKLHKSGSSWVTEPGFVNFVATPGAETGASVTAGMNSYKSYVNAYEAGKYPGIPAAATDSAAIANGGERGRRIIAIPFIDCSSGNIDNKSVTVVGFGCFFMAREYGNASNSTPPYDYDPHPYPGSNKYIYGTFIGADEDCVSLGKVTSKSNFDFYKVQLYKDPFGGHS